MQRTWIILVVFVVMSPLLSFADINEDMIEASKKGRTDEVRSLLDAGAEVNVKDEWGETSLMWAAGVPSLSGGGNAYPEIVKLLLEAGADVNAEDEDGATALFYAASRRGRDELIKLLLLEHLESGTDVNARNEDDWTALMVAADSGHSEIVETLKKAGAKE